MDASEANDIAAKAIQINEDQRENKVNIFLVKEVYPRIRTLAESMHYKTHISYPISFDRKDREILIEKLKDKKYSVTTSDNGIYISWL